MKTRIGFQQLCAITVLLVLVSAQMAPAQQAGLPANGTHTLTAAASAPNAAVKAPATAQEEENTAAAGKPDGNGIKIHGHWVLEVKNPDGKLVDRREFNNSLVTGGTYLSGDQLLAAILTGDLTPGGFAVTLITGSTTGLDPTTLCQINTNTPLPIGITCNALLNPSSWLYQLFTNNGEEWLGLLWDNAQPGLNASVSFSPSVNIVLSGNYTVGCSLSDGNSSDPTCGHTMAPITAVQTYLAGCGNSGNNVFGYSYSDFFSNFEDYPSTRFSGSTQPIQQAAVSSKACNPAGDSVGGSLDPATVVAIGTLTSAILPNGPLTVTTGQILTITVTLSFS